MHQLRPVFWLMKLLGKDSMNRKDEDFVRSYQRGEKEVAEILLNKYKNMVRAKASTMFLLGGDREDLIQEGMIALFQALSEYDVSKDASFATFAELCVTRKMYSAVRTFGRKKHGPLNSSISLNAAYDAENGEHLGKAGDGGLSIGDLLSHGERENPEVLLIDRENAEALEKRIDTELTDFEREVLTLYMSGLRNTEIAALLGKKEKSADNALQRVRSKLKRAL